MTEEIRKEEPPSQIGSGQISGGWEFIWAAYGITWVALMLYMIFVWTRGAK